MAERRARVLTARLVADETLELTFACHSPERLPFRPGQFVSVACGPDRDGKPQRRSYSIASAATLSDRFTLIIKLVEGGHGSAYLRALRPGSEIGFTGPMGFFVPDLQHEGDVVFAATGVGIAPVFPMLLELLARPAERGRVTVHWGVRHARDFFYRDWLDALCAREPRLETHLYVSRADERWQGERGRITSAVLAHTSAPGAEQRTFYVVGNGEMIRDVSEGLVRAGIQRKKQIRVEVFYPASPRKAGA